MDQEEGQDGDVEEEVHGNRDLRKAEEVRSHGAGNRREDGKEGIGSGSLEEEVRGSDLRGTFDSPAKASMSARDNAEDYEIWSGLGVGQATLTMNDCVDGDEGDRCRDRRGHEEAGRWAHPHLDLDTTTFSAVRKMGSKSVTNSIDQFELGSPASNKLCATTIKQATGLLRCCSCRQRLAAGGFCG